MIVVRDHPGVRARTRLTTRRAIVSGPGEQGRSGRELFGRRSDIECRIGGDLSPGAQIGNASRPDQTTFPAMPTAARTPGLFLILDDAIQHLQAAGRLIGSGSGGCRKGVLVDNTVCGIVRDFCQAQARNNISRPPRGRQNRITLTGRASAVG